MDHVAILEEKASEVVSYRGEEWYTDAMEFHDILSSKKTKIENLKPNEKFTKAKTGIKQLLHSLNALNLNSGIHVLVYQEADPQIKNATPFVFGTGALRGMLLKESFRTTLKNGINAPGSTAKLIF